jgi:hypothetical protein
MLAMALVLAPAGVIAGGTVKRTGGYRTQLVVAWIFVLAGAASLISLEQNSPTALGIGLLPISAIGIGILITTTYFPVLAPRTSLYTLSKYVLTMSTVPISTHPLALSYFMFLRYFAQVRAVNYPVPSQS